MIVLEVAIGTDRCVFNFKNKDWTDMKIHAMAKHKFDEYVKSLGVDPDTVEGLSNKYFISITHPIHPDSEPDDEWVPIFKENKKNVLCLIFDDIISPVDILFANGTIMTKSFSNEQAKEVINFLSSIKNEEDTELYVHCAMGSSRSVAVAEFAAAMFGQNPDFINARIDRKANSHVLNLLKEEYKNHTKWNNWAISWIKTTSFQS